MKKFQSCFELSKALLMSDPELPLCEVKGGHIQLPATHFIINSNGPLDKQYAGCDPRRWAAFVARFTEQEETEDRSSISIASNQKLAGKIHQEIIAAVLAFVQTVDTWTAGPDVTMWLHVMDVTALKRFVMKMKKDEEKEQELGNHWPHSGRLKWMKRMERSLVSSLPLKDIRSGNHEERHGKTWYHEPQDRDTTCMQWRDGAHEKEDGHSRRGECKARCYHQTSTEHCLLVFWVSWLGHRGKASEVPTLRTKTL